jgi:predicted ATPase
VLNGTLARLGQFDDLRSYGGEFDQITIGWELRPTEGAQTDILDNTHLPGMIVPYGRRMDSIKAIACNLAFDARRDSPERELFQLQPQLFLFTLSLLARAEDNTDQRYELTVKRNPDGRAKMANLKAEDPDNEITRAALEYDIVLDEHSLEGLREELMTADPVGCTLRHFLPDRLLVRVNVVEEIAQQIHAILMDDVPRYRRVPFMDRELAIPGALIAQLQMRLDKEHVQWFDKQPTLFEEGAGMPVREWIFRTRRLPPNARRELRRVLSEWTDLRTTIANILRSERNVDESEYQLLAYRAPSDLSNASAYLSTFFSNSVKYLGPLRDEPKPLYPLAAHADPTDVGLRGETTAAVLNLHRERLIRFIPSAAFGKTPFTPSPVPRFLEAAVTDWLQYLGVAEKAHSIDKGKLGHELKVSLSENGPEHDLTHVGVGVSQVLPILVMSLLADRDTTLVFEQPELHLHPKVQTRLADFFLSMALLGKQCLIETHSEYLINRLRYRAASQGDDNRITSNLKMYFVEKRDGCSSFREVRVNEYGAILDWPEGFFDQSQLESESILRAAVTKRKHKRGT